MITTNILLPWTLRGVEIASKTSAFRSNILLQPIDLFLISKLLKLLDYLNEIIQSQQSSQIDLEGGGIVCQLNCVDSLCLSVRLTVLFLIGMLYYMSINDLTKLLCKPLNG